MIRDSGSGRHGEDSRSEAECEAPQSGPVKTGHRPASGANLTPSGVEWIRAEAFEEAAKVAEAEYLSRTRANREAHEAGDRKRGRGQASAAASAVTIMHEIRALALPSKPPQPISSKKLIALLDDPRIAAAVNDRGAYGKAAFELPRQVCPHCNDTGDVHRADGEWLGKCDCGAQPPSQGDVEGRDLLGIVRNALYRHLPTHIHADVCRAVADEILSALASKEDGRS